MRVRISRALHDRLLTEAEAQPEREVCGLLFGNDDEVQDALPAANVAPDRARHFEVDPRTLFAAIRAERAGGPRLIGHYHSHPNGRPEPSARDAASAEPGALWLIVAAGQVRAFRYGEDGFTPADLDPV